MIKRKQLGRISATEAEQEPEAERLFTRKPRLISPETRALFERIEASRRDSARRNTNNP